MPLGSESYLLVCPKCGAQGPDNFREEQRYSVRVMGENLIPLPGKRVLVCASCGWVVNQNSLKAQLEAAAHVESETSTRGRPRKKEEDAAKD
jgi:predicted RNA-binding Zn-ribbon protein involved in translation (DUF1610 family)